jgi:nucleotide-binding universal stress UspA family protein
MAETQPVHPFGVVLAATRFTPACDAAVEAAFGMARHFGSRLILMHVAGRRSDAPAARLRLGAWAARAPDLAIETTLAFGEPGHAVARAARHEHADLVIIGRGRASDSLVQLGIEEVLARAAPCPVISFGPGDSVAAAIRHLQAAQVLPRHCLLCAQASDELICETCRTRVTAEASEHKRRIEKATGNGH